MMESETQELLGGGLLRYWPHYLAPGTADALMSELRGGLDWQERSLRMFGKSLLEPRLSVWMGDLGADYRYSGRLHTPSPWHAALASLRDRLAGELGVAFNGVLANLYRNERDSMGWHADNENELGEDPCIASLSLGETRRFILRHVDGARMPYNLGPGSLLVMSGPVQEKWRHALPKARGPLGPRINLSYRWIRSLGASGSSSSGVHLRG